MKPENKEINTRPITDNPGVRMKSMIQNKKNRIQHQFYTVIETGGSASMSRASIGDSDRTVFRVNSRYKERNNINSKPMKNSPYRVRFVTRMNTMLRIKELISYIIFKMGYSSMPISSLDLTRSSLNFLYRASNRLWLEQWL